MDIKVQEFKTGLKSVVAKDFTVGCVSAYESFKQKFLSDIMDEDLRENVRIHLPTKDSLKSACYRARALPKAPLNRSDIDLELLDICKDEYLIDYSTKEGVYLFGTVKLLTEFSNAKFKSVDGTFKIAPRLFFQTMIFMCQIGGNYVTTMMAVLPDKEETTYDILFRYKLSFTPARFWGHLLFFFAPCCPTPQSPVRLSDCILNR